MGYWDYSNIGFSCAKKNAKQVRKLLECMGVDFVDLHGSEAGIINSKFWDAELGCDNSELKTEVIYTIVNRLFEGTTIFYESEEGNNTSDYYTRYEEIYDPKANIVFVGEKDYCYDGNEVFGQSAYDLIKDECEAAAKKQGIPIEWGDYYPEGEEFYYLCEGILEDNGGIEGLGTKETTKEIPSVEIQQEDIIRLIDDAAKRGYNSLVEMLLKGFDIKYESPFLSESKEDNNPSFEEKNKCAEMVRKKLDELGGRFELQATQFEGRNDRIEIIKVGEKLTLLREPDSDFDPNSIDVRWNGNTMGYLPWDAAEVLADPLDEELIDAVAEVIEVVPLSTRSKRCKKGLLYVKISVEPNGSGV